MILPATSKYGPGVVFFGGGSTTSVLHPLVLAAMAVVLIAAFTLRRKYVIVPLLLGILLIPMGQNLYVFGSHFFTFRMIVLAILARAFLSRPQSGRFLAGGFCLMDGLFLTWALNRAICGILLDGTPAVINTCGFLIDSVGGYFLFRTLIRDVKDVQRVASVLAVVSIAATVFMLNELRTGHNVLFLLGGIAQDTEIRNGRIRAEAFFQHAILAGAFGATSFPLFLWLWTTGKRKSLALAGSVSSILMVFASASSTPVGAFLGCLLALGAWPLRRQMRAVRWSTLGLIVMLALVMKAPVWYLIQRVDFVGGSTGEDRAVLFDQCWQHIGEWWLIGTHNYVNWFWDTFDVCNQYVFEAVSGGLLGLAAFIAMISVTFRNIGTARRMVSGSLKNEWLCWLLGVSLFTHLMAFIGVSYFDQSRFLWFAFFAMVIAFSNSVKESRQAWGQGKARGEDKSHSEIFGESGVEESTEAQERSTPNGVLV
jgi:hypothetical protein